jgi:hypothetical protein
LEAWRLASQEAGRRESQEAWRLASQEAGRRESQEAGRLASREQKAEAWERSWEVGKVRS